MLKSGIAGFSARCITVSMLMPFTVLKTRIEVSKYILTVHTYNFKCYYLIWFVIFIVDKLKICFRVVNIITLL